MNSKGSTRKTTNVLQLIYKHRHHCLKHLLPRLKQLNWNDVKDTKDSYGSSALHYVLFYCTGNGVLDVVKYILRQEPGALYKETNQLMTPIHIMPGVNFNGDAQEFSLESIQRDQLKARSFLMKQNPTILTHINGFGRLPLSEAVVKGCNRIVKHMLKEYPDVARKKEANDRIPLYHAIRTENAFATALLMSSYPESLLMTCSNDSNPQTFLQIALTLPTLASPVRQQFEKILTDMFNLDKELDKVQEKLDAANATIRSKNAKAKEDAKLIETLQNQLKSRLNDEGSSSSSPLSTIPNADDTATASLAKNIPRTIELGSGHDYYWNQTRKSELICLNNLLTPRNETSIQDVTAIVQSLARRLDCHPLAKGDDESYSQCNHSMARQAAKYILKDSNPDKSDMYKTIDCLNQELIQLEEKGTPTADQIAKGDEKKPPKRSSSENHLSSPAAKRTKTVASAKQMKPPSTDSGGEESDVFWV